MRQPIPDKADRVVLHHWWWGLAGVVTFGGFAAALWLPRQFDPEGVSTDDPVTTAIALAVFVVLALVFLTLYFWGRIEANSTGIAIRDFRGRQTFSWSDVKDYYLDGLHSGACVIQLAQRSIRIPRRRDQTKALESAVIANCAHLGSKPWGALGGRPKDPWPRRFHYHMGPMEQWGLILFSLLVILGGILWVSFLMSGMSFETWHGYAICGVVSIMFLLFPALFLTLILVELLDYRRRRSHKLLATETGIEFEALGRHVTAKWGSVVSRESPPSTIWGTKTKQMRIETPDGAFDISSKIENFAALEQTVTLMTPHLNVPTPLALPHTGAPPLIIHPWVANTKVPLIGLTVWVTGLTPIVISKYLELGWSPKTTAPLLSLLILSTILIAAHIYFNSFRVEVSAESLAFRTIWRRAQVRWSDISDYYLALNWEQVTCLVIVPRDGKPMRFPVRSNFDCGPLKDLIRRMAVNSTKKEWELRTK
ncbi:MAG: hypothetical protein K1X53_13790 [Candidatus Sumerlaeaceae bacterium]|nr:hypothetical protein [Candidatus Sumerlaeaceae bacterium]